MVEVSFLAVSAAVSAVAGGDGVLEAPEVRLDGRLVAQVLQTLPLGDAHPFALLLRVSQSSIPPVFP